MKCFECGQLCKTVYHTRTNFIDINQSKIWAVSKQCPNCGWESYKTKLPEKIP